MRTAFPRPTLNAIAAALVVGLILAVLCASIVSLARPSVPPRSGPQYILGPVPGSTTFSWYVNRHARFGHTAYVFRKAQTQAGQRLGTPHRDPATLPTWAPIPPRGMRFDTHGYGWPLPCLRATELNQTDTFLWLRPRFSWSRHLRIPVEPIPLGLVVNSLAWSIPAGAILYISAYARRRRRRRCGHCPICNYDLTAAPHTTCPECGAPV